MALTCLTQDFLVLDPVVLLGAVAAILWPWGKTKKVIEKASESPTSIELLNFPPLQPLVPDTLFSKTTHFLLFVLFSLVFLSLAGKACLLRYSERPVVELPKVTHWPGTVEGHRKLGLCDPSPLHSQEVLPFPSRMCKSSLQTCLAKAAIKRALRKQKLSIYPPWRKRKGWRHSTWDMWWGCITRVLQLGVNVSLSWVPGSFTLKAFISVYNSHFVEPKTLWIT